MKGPNPILLAQIAVNRKAGGRAQRRAAEALARVAGATSIPAMKKRIRRNKQRKPNHE